MKIIGEQTYLDAVKIYEAEKQEDKKEARKNNIRILLTMPLLIALASAIIFVLFGCVEGFNTMFTQWGSAKVVLLILVNIVAIVIAHTAGDYTPKNTRYDFSPIWQYATITKDNNVLARKLRYNDWNGWWVLELDLEDKITKSVSYASIYPFWSVTKTDVDDYVVDLEHNKLIKPYHSEHCRLSEQLPQTENHKSSTCQNAKVKRENIVVPVLSKS